MAERDTGGESARRTNELITGLYRGELDTEDPANRIITDLAFAPRNARGRVEYSATFALTRARAG